MPNGLKVLISGGVQLAWRSLAQEFQQQYGIPILWELGASTGEMPSSIPGRIGRGDPFDVVIMARQALEQLVDAGKVTRSSRIDLAMSHIAVAVRAGAPRYDAGSVEALRAAILAAKSIALSSSVSGIYISSVVFKRLAIDRSVVAKSHIVHSEPVGAYVARGEAELGFQQLSELKGIAGIDIVGPLPPSLQNRVLYSAGVVTGTKQMREARRLLDFLASPAASAVLHDSGLDPLRPPATRRIEMSNINISCHRSRLLGHALANSFFTPGSGNSTKNDDREVLIGSHFDSSVDLD